MADEDSHSTDSIVSGDGHSDPLKVVAEAAARLSTPAPVMLRYNGNRRSDRTLMSYMSLLLFKNPRPEENILG